jgi:hypothetical protein
MNDGDNRPISEQYRLVALEWADADAAANLLEETKSAYLAKLMSAYGDIPVSKAEMKAKSSEEWGDFVTNMVYARQRATKLKVELEYERMKFFEWQAHGANRRAEMKL